VFGVFLRIALLINLYIGHLYVPNIVLDDIDGTPRYSVKFNESSPVK
jgi:hypothetical protein